MSVVVAIKKDNKIYLGCDTQVSAGNNKSVLENGAQKIFDLRNLPDQEIMVGAVGSLRDVQLVQCSGEIVPRDIVLDDILNYDWVVDNFFTNVYNVLAKHLRNKVTEQGISLPILDDEFILAYKDDAWIIDQEGCVIPISDYLAIGSGADIATGVLESTKNSKMKPEERILSAIKACADLTLFVNDDVLIGTTERKKVK